MACRCLKDMKYTVQIGIVENAPVFFRALDEWSRVADANAGIGDAPVNATISLKSCIESRLNRLRISHVTHNRIAFTTR